MNLKEKYQKEVIPKLKKELGLANSLALPRIVKVTLNVGIGKSKDVQAAINKGYEQGAKRSTQNLSREKEELKPGR